MNTNEKVQISDFVFNSNRKSSQLSFSARETPIYTQRLKCQFDNLNRLQDVKDLKSLVNFNISIAGKRAQSSPKYNIQAQQNTSPDLVEDSALLTAIEQLHNR